MPESTISLIDTAVITGGNSGLGKAMAESLSRADKQVILVGRSESSLKTTASEVNAAAYYVLDTGDTKAIPDVAQRILKSHPEVNCLINNAAYRDLSNFPMSATSRIVDLI